MPRMPRPFSTNALCIPMRQFYALTIYPLAALWLSRFLDSLASSLPIIASLLVRRAIYRFSCRCRRSRRASSNTHHLLAVVVRHRHGMDTTALNPPRSVALPGSPLMLAPQGASVPSTYKCNDPDECITPLYYHHLRRPIPSAPALLPPPATLAAAPRYEVRWPSSAHPHRRLVRHHLTRGVHIPRRAAWLLAFLSLAAHPSSSRTPLPRIRTTHVPIHLPPTTREHRTSSPPHSFTRPIYRSLCSYLVLYCATIYLMGLRRHTARTLVVGVGMRTRPCRVVVVATLRPT
ncbi:hypothetical protein EV122DRAFT_262172, partial [Schizophyllum commune]